MGHPSKFQRLSRLDGVTARYSSSGRQPKFAALNRGRHLHSAGRPSRWALAHILVLRYFTEFGSFRGALRKSGRGVPCTMSLCKSSRSLSHLLMSFFVVFNRCGEYSGAWTAYYSLLHAAIPLSMSVAGVYCYCRTTEVVPCMFSAL